MIRFDAKTLKSADGTKIFAEAVGDPRKPALVFLHGLGLTGIAFDNQFEDPQLYENVYLVRYDMRGHGRSGMPADATAYESIRHAEDFKAVCDGYWLVKPNVLGWSLGGAMIADIVEAYGGDYIGAVIYCGGSLLTRTLHNNYIHPYLKSLVPDILSTDANVIAAAAPKFVESIVENMDKVLTYREQLALAGGYAIMPATARIHHVTRTQTSERWEKDIKSKHVMIIQGTHDRHARAEGLVEEAKKWLGPFELKLLEGCGHSPVLERPHEVNVYISSFILRTSSREETVQSVL